MVRQKRREWRLAAAGLMLGLLVTWPAGRVEAGEPRGGPSGEVSVQDSGSQINPVTFECTPGHKAETRLISLDSGAVKYTFRYCGCQDPSHGDLRPAAEGNFGMPAPTTANWYWGGFLFVLVNGKDATQYRLGDLRVIETGRRGALQILWAHPDAEVGLRLLMLPGANHVMAYLVWRPRPQAAVKSVVVRLVCYPSFFTAARHRRGERHCQIPRIDKREPEALKLVPDQDVYLYFYDKVFDTAKGEGDGPCAALVAPEAVLGGQVQIGDYAVITELRLKGEAGQARLAFYDFTGRTNAEAEAYLKAHAVEDLAQLANADFRPEAVRRLQADRLQAEATQLLAAAADDGKPYRAKIEEFLSRVAALKASADRGDWKAEAELASVLAGSEDLFWKLKAMAALNSNR
jgi:hypothetical protein